MSLNICLLIDPYYPTVSFSLPLKLLAYSHMSIGLINALLLIVCAYSLPVQHHSSVSFPPLLHLSLLPSIAAILDDQSVCGRGERLALALARENINSVMEGPARARVEVDIYELQKDSQYDTTDTSK